MCICSYVLLYFEILGGRDVLGICAGLLCPFRHVKIGFPGLCARGCRFGVWVTMPAVWVFRVGVWLCVICCRCFRLAMVVLNIFG